MGRVYRQIQCVSVARLAQSVEHQTFKCDLLRNLRVKGSSPLSGGHNFEISVFITVHSSDIDIS
jgi:hypothetical protein